MELISHGFYQTLFVPQHNRATLMLLIEIVVNCIGTSIHPIKITYLFDKAISYSINYSQYIGNPLVTWKADVLIRQLSQKLMIFFWFCVTRKYFNEITLVLKLKRKYIIIQPTSILLIVTFLSNSISLYVTQRASGEILQFFLCNHKEQSFFIDISYPVVSSVHKSFLRLAVNLRLKNSNCLQSRTVSVELCNGKTLKLSLSDDDDDNDKNDTYT